MKDGEAKIDDSLKVARLLSDLEFGVMSGYSPTPIIQTKSKGMGRSILSGIM